MGCSSVSLSMKEFQECVDDIEMVDLKRSGIHFTWNQKPKKGIGLMKKIDRVMGNSQFIAKYPSAVAVFHPSRLSDHCPCVVSFPETEELKHRSFKFANFLAYKPEFLPLVEKVWGMTIGGVYQFSVVKKLRQLKSLLRVLLYQQGNLHKKVQELRDKLDRIQCDIDKDPTSQTLRDAEATTRCDYQAALLDEERFLKQKSKVDWLAAGDMNTAYFHSSLKNRVHYSRIEVIRDIRGNEFTDDMVSKAFVDHYEHFLGCPGDTSFNPTPDLFTKRLERDVAAHMVRPVTPDEVKKAMFSFGSDKAPGPDGFTADSISRGRRGGDRARLDMGPYITRIASHFGVLDVYQPQFLHRGPTTAIFRLEDLQKAGIASWEAPYGWEPIREGPPVQPPQRGPVDVEPQ
ncbi:uncharacterized protein LOC110875662 [Helianthus annuus]|uniref:uncharacterized protein LOC110875662 n=1 Tax=Helianthus annuus TaxID=4232 RepID=UPI000B8F9898|nr:uncharacterized protein LOC110875662 [Helianthus annuus]